jgi:hypothetical protein
LVVVVMGLLALEQAPAAGVEAAALLAIMPSLPDKA